MASRSRFQSRMVSAIGISLALVAIAELTTPSPPIPPNSIVNLTFNPTYSLLVSSTFHPKYYWQEQ